MAKPKIDFKKILLEKGEKYGLIAGVALMALLVFWGIMTAIGSASTEKEAKKITDEATRVKNTAKRSDSGEKPPELESWVRSKVRYTEIPPDQYRNGLYFIDILIDQQKRGNPEIKVPNEFQVDFFRGVYYGHEFVVVNGERVKIYIL